MEIVVTSAEMKACDRYAIDHHRLPALLLMENAGRCVAEIALELLRATTGNEVALFCGTGNNGGDGFVAARHLLESGVRVRVVLIGRRTALKGDALVHFNVLRSLERENGTRDTLDVVIDPTGRKTMAARPPSLIIDALLGIGYRGSLRGGYRKVVEWINHQGVPTLSVDIPSGLDADTGRVDDLCVRADSTVTMGFLKSGLLTGRGPEFCGDIVTVGLGVPLRLPSSMEEGTFVLGSADVRAALPMRKFDAHKHSTGKILVCAGSVGFTGAASLTAMSALKSGAGMVVLATPRSVYPVLARKLTEVVVKPVKDSPEGTFCAESLESIERELEWADVIIVGPGLGLTPSTAVFINKLLKTTGKRFLFDADGLTHIASENAILGNLRKNRCILTPHAGEFARLTSIGAGLVANDRLELARKYAKHNKITLIFKGSPTLIADAEGRVFISRTGNKGMATAGTGDVLAGVVGALWAESDDPVTAAYAGAYIHGEAGDLAAALFGYRSLTAGDLLSQLPQALKVYNDN